MCNKSSSREKEVLFFHTGDLFVWKDVYKRPDNRPHDTTQKQHREYISTTQEKTTGQRKEYGGTFNVRVVVYRVDDELKKNGKKYIEIKSRQLTWCRLGPWRVSVSPR